MLQLHEPVYCVYDVVYITEEMLEMRGEHSWKSIHRNPHPTPHSPPYSTQPHTQPPITYRLVRHFHQSMHRGPTPNRGLHLHKVPLARQKHGAPRIHPSGPCEERPTPCPQCHHCRCTVQGAVGGVDDGVGCGGRVGVDGMHGGVEMNRKAGAPQGMTLLKEPCCCCACIL